MMKSKIARQASAATIAFFGVALGIAAILLELNGFWDWPDY